MTLIGKCVMPTLTLSMSNCNCDTCLSKHKKNVVVLLCSQVSFFKHKVFFINPCFHCGVYQAVLSVKENSLTVYKPLQMMSVILHCALKHRIVQFL